MRKIPATIKCEVSGLWKPCIIFISSLLGSLFFLNTGYAQLQATQQYPDWFFKTPQTGHFYAVGYSPVQFYGESTIDRAFANLKDHLNAKKGLKLQLAMFWEKLPDGSVSLKGQEIAAEALFESDNLPYSVASAVTGRMQLVLGSYISGVPFPQTTMVSPGNQPAWIQELPKDNRYWYAKGAASLGIREYVAWQKAEQNALFELAQQQSVHLQMVERQLANATESVILMETDVVLHNVQVIERWRDETTCYVLIRAD